MRAEFKRDWAVLHMVYSTPWASADQLAKIHRVEDLAGLRTSLRNLKAAGRVAVAPYQGMHAPARVNLLVVTDEGVEALTRRFRWSPSEGYGGIRMVSRQWQRHLARHADVVQLAYDIMARLVDLLGLEAPRNIYFPRVGSLDAMIWDSFSTGRSIGIIRKGPLMSEKVLRERLVHLVAGDDLLHHHTEYIPWGRRGPGVVIIVMQNELEKACVLDWFDKFGDFSKIGLTVVVATEAAAHHRSFTLRDDGKDVTIGIGHVAAYQPPHSTYRPQAPRYRHHSALPVEKLPPVLPPVQRRILDALYRWPLMRPTQIAPTIGTSYQGRYTGYIKDLIARGLVKTIRDVDLEAAGLPAYDPAEYRDLPVLLSDTGLKWQATHDRASSGAVLAKWSTERVNNDTGALQLGGSIRKLIRDRDHTIGVNGLVSRVCSELPYTPVALPDHMATRSYKSSWWTADERPLVKSVAPDATILLKSGDARRTILLEYERQATRGGEALTRKLLVWLAYFAHHTNVGEYLGLEIYAFVVPTASAKKLTIERCRDLLPYNTPRWSRVPWDNLPLVVATEADVADSVLHNPVWTIASTGHSIALTQGFEA